MVCGSVLDELLGERDRPLTNDVGTWTFTAALIQKSKSIRGWGAVHAAAQWSTTTCRAAAGMGESTVDSLVIFLNTSMPTIQARA